MGKGVWRTKVRLSCNVSEPRSQVWRSTTIPADQAQFCWVCTAPQFHSHELQLLMCFFVVEKFTKCLEEQLGAYIIDGTYIRRVVFKRYTATIPISLISLTSAAFIRILSFQYLIHQPSGRQVAKIYLLNLESTKSHSGTSGFLSLGMSLGSVFRPVDPQSLR